MTPRPTVPTAFVEDTSRLEAFSDGVFAIAITLLILEIRVPHAADTGTTAALWAGLRALWPSYLAFLLSFFVILVMWVNHHELMRMLKGVDYPLLFANGFLLLMVTFVPFPTAVLAQHLNTDSATAAAAFYCGCFIPISASWGLTFWTMVRRNLFRPEIDDDTIGRIANAYKVGPAVYLLSTGVAFFSATAGLVLNTSLWLLWIRLCYHPLSVAAAELDEAGART
jgi:TMEM175 potassium channel family protein